MVLQMDQDAPLYCDHETRNSVSGSNHFHGLASSSSPSSMRKDHGQKGGNAVPQPQTEPLSRLGGALERLHATSQSSRMMQGLKQQRADLKKAKARKRPVMTPSYLMSGGSIKRAQSDMQPRSQIIDPQSSPSKHGQWHPPSTRSLPLANNQNESATFQALSMPNAASPSTRRPALRQNVTRGSTFPVDAESIAPELRFLQSHDDLITDGDDHASAPQWQSSQRSLDFSLDGTMDGTVSFTERHQARLMRLAARRSNKKQSKDIQHAATTSWREPTLEDLDAPILTYQRSENTIETVEEMSSDRDMIRVDMLPNMMPDLKVATSGEVTQSTATTMTTLASQTSAGSIQRLPRSSRLRQSQRLSLTSQRQASMRLLDAIPHQDGCQRSVEDTSLSLLNSNGGADTLTNDDEQDDEHVDADDDADDDDEQDGVGNRRTTAQINVSLIAHQDDLTRDSTLPSEDDPLSSIPRSASPILSSDATQTLPITQKRRMPEPSTDRTNAVEKPSSRQPRRRPGPDAGLQSPPSRSGKARSQSFMSPNSSSAVVAGIASPPFRSLGRPAMPPRSLSSPLSFASPISSGGLRRRMPEPPTRSNSLVVKSLPCVAIEAIIYGDAEQRKSMVLAAPPVCHIEIMPPMMEDGAARDPSLLEPAQRKDDALAPEASIHRGAATWKYEDTTGQIESTGFRIPEQEQEEHSKVDEEGDVATAPTQDVKEDAPPTYAEPFSINQGKLFASKSAFEDIMGQHRAMAESAKHSERQERQSELTDMVDFTNVGLQSVRRKSFTLSNNSFIIDYTHTVDYKGETIWQCNSQCCGDYYSNIGTTTMCVLTAKTLRVIQFHKQRTWIANFEHDTKTRDEYDVLSLLRASAELYATNNSNSVDNSQEDDQPAQLPPQTMSKTLQQNHSFVTQRRSSQLARMSMVSTDTSGSFRLQPVPQVDDIDDLLFVE